MKRRARNASAPQREADPVAHSRELLERLARILVRSGHSPKSLAREFTEICATMKEPKQPWDPDHLSFVSDLPHVLTHWRSEPRFVDPSGAPLPLALHGRGPSLTELIEQVLPTADPAKVVRALVQLRGLARRGQRYVPTDRYLVFNPQASSALAHALTMVLGMLSTLEHNVFGQKGTKLLERGAINPRFPVQSLDAVHHLLKSRAETFLDSIDKEMHRLARRRGSQGTTRVGVGLFAFEDPHITDKRHIVPRKKGVMRRKKPA